MDNCKFVRKRKDEIDKIKLSSGKITPYPGRSGIRFKDLASKTGLGRIGDNFLFLLETIKKS